MIEFLSKIENNVKQNGNRIAYVIDNKKITYSQLWNKAQISANLLKKQDISPVILYGHKSIEMIISILACLLAKRAYIPIDLCTPLNRIKQIIDLSGAKLLIKNENLDVDFIENCTLDELIMYENNDIVTSNNNIAYIIFTSGSTGEPKGVPISYDNLNNFYKWISKVPPLNSYKNINVLNQASFSFDLSVADLYYSLGNSHTLFGLHRDSQNDYGDIFNVIYDNNINLLVITPTFMKLCLINQDFNENRFKELKCIYFCGEQLEVKLVEKIFHRFPNIQIINAYGPTEATSAVSSILITKDMLQNELLPVGDMDNLATDIIVANGQIILKGDSVFSGYLGNINGGHYIENNVNCYKTGDIGFIYNNMLYCKGRCDSQIKYKGYRIELMDIENNLRKIDGVIDCCVVAKYHDQFNVKFIKGFVILENGYDVNRVKKELSGILPGYMMPKYFKAIDKFPINNNGKIDRKKLSEL